VSSLEQEVAALREQLQQGGQPTNDPVVAAQTYMQSKTQEIDQQALLAYNHYVANEVAQGLMTAEQAQHEIGMLRQAALAQVQAQALQIAVLPAAQQMAAERIAKEFTVGDMKLTAADLLAEAPRGVDAMRARAKALQEERRNASYQKRVVQGTDRAEAGSSTTLDPRILEDLSGVETIKLGVVRGHNS
jgi:hypothetical protein